VVVRKQARVNQPGRTAQPSPTHSTVPSPTQRRLRKRVSVDRGRTDHPHTGTHRRAAARHRNRRSHETKTDQRSPIDRSHAERPPTVSDSNVRHAPCSVACTMQPLRVAVKQRGPPRIRIAFGSAARRHATISTRRR
jgi:hypothetical protein